MRRALAVVGAIVVAGACLWYVVAPPKGPEAYRERLGAAAEALRSQVQTARIWGETVADGDATRSAALVGFREAEHAAGSAANQLESYEPPSDLTGLRSRFSSLAGEVTSTLSELRVEAELERWEEVDHLLPRLHDLAERLARLRSEAA